MKISVLLLLVSFFLTHSLTAQTRKITGVVTDKKSGLTLPMVFVKLVETNTPNETDMDGNYAFENIPNGTYTMVFKMEGYETDTLTGIIVNNNTVNVSLAMREPAITQLEGAEIVFVRDKSKDDDFVAEQKNDASVRDGMSAQAMSKTGDTKTSDVLKRVSGASIQDNRFVVIRGLSDRYNMAYINGAPLPSSESDRKAFAFDIFPSNMLDNLTITKTATPEMPGEFAGGVITINTKAPSSKNFQTFLLGTSFNTLTTFKNFQTYEGSNTDWAGIDNGARKLPNGLPDSKTFNTLGTSQKADYAKLMTPSWGISDRLALPALNLQYGLGRNYQIKGHDLGFVFAYTYQNMTSTNQNIRREFEEQAAGVVQKSELTDTVYSQKLLNSAMFNLSYELNDRNKISFNNLYSINSEDRVNIRHGVREMDSDPHQYEKSSNRWFTQNNLYTGQLEGNHEFKKEGMVFNWIGGYSNVQRTIPNMRRVVYQKSALSEDDTTAQYVAVVQNNGTIPTAAGNMFWSETKEQIYSFNYNLSIPWDLKNVKNIFKIGGFQQYRDRDFSARNFGFSRYKTSDVSFDNSLLLLPENEIFAPEHLGLMENGKGGFKLEEATKVSDSYTASSMLHAGFAMFDTKILTRFRMVGGVRMESYNQKFNYTEAGSNIDRHIDTTVIDLLPSLNLIYSLNKRMNIRLSYYRTVSRPEFRELAPFAFYNFALDNILSGNPNLKRAVIDNFDARFEYFIGGGQLFTVSTFYKNFTNPIELVNRTGISGAAELYYTNVPNVVNYGIETEYRIKLDVLSKNKESRIWSNTTLYTNLALIRSQVDVSQVNGAGTDSRPLQGQSPFIVNAGLQYEHPTKNWSVNASYNVIGRRIFIVGNVQEPSVWENSRNVIDLQFAKTFSEKFQLKINLKDLLAQDLVFYQDLNKNNKFDPGTDNKWQQTNFGQTLSISLSYKL
jgi:outer membrane receptor protein involved in Fe transport